MKKLYLTGTKEFNSLLNSLPFQGKEAAKGFTLVELIVVITIIAILGTIAFISLQGYSANARDSTRISDLSAMKTSLELFHLDAGKYPNTTAGFEVTYSGTVVWTQGTFGETTFTNVEKLDKTPKDPLTDKKYTYSVTKTKQEYQLAGIMESGEITLNNNVLLNQTNAGDTIATAIVTGNYNGQVLKTQTGVICEILSLPSIISSELETVTNLITILGSGSLVYSGYNNLPSNYIGGKYKTNGGFEFESKKLIVYSDTQECKPLYAEDPTARIELIKNLKTAYSGTIIENSDNISGLVALDIGNLEAVTLLSTTLVNNNLGGNISQTNNIVILTNSCATQPTYVFATFTIGAPTSIGQAWQNTNIANPCYYTCTGGYTGADCSIPPFACGTATVTRDSLTYGIVTGADGKCWLDRNLGATSVATAYNDTQAYGWYFQWGRDADGHQISTSGITATNSSSDTPGHANFITESVSPNDWRIPKNDNLWQGVNGINNPCPTGWRLPTQPEWATLVSSAGITNYTTAFNSTLKLTAAGNRTYLGALLNQNNVGIYRSSTPTPIDTKALSVYFDSSAVNVNNNNLRAFGFSVRCIKD